MEYKITTKERMIQTMQVLCNKYQLAFPTTRWNELTGMNEYAGGDTVSVSPKPTPQTIPDWVRDTNTFKMAVSAGQIFEINVVTQPQVILAPEPPAPQAEAPAKKAKPAKVA